MIEIDKGLRVSLMRAGDAILVINFIWPNDDESDPILRAINKYKNHPNILKIKEAVGYNEETFSFVPTTLEKVSREITSLNNSTACPKYTIPPRVVKENIDMFACKLHNDFNNSIYFSNFPCNLKKADITPAHKKGDRTDKCNYRPVSILPAISKIYERLLYYQMNSFMNNNLSK